MDLLLTQVRGFVREELFSVEGRLGSLHDFAALKPELERLRQIVRERGWWLPQIAREHGGLGLSLPDFGRLSEVLGQSPFGHYVFNCQAPDAGNMELLLSHASPEQHTRFLAPLLAGKTRSCFAMTEPEHAGSNPLVLSCTAVADGDHYVLNGHKWFTTAADGAAFAIVMAVTDPQAHPYARASMLLVPTDTPGYERIRNISVMGDVGSGYFSHAEIRFQDCRVPRANLLGAAGAGFMMAQERLGPGRIHHCMRWIGIAERAFSMMCQRAVSRELSPGKSLATRQTVLNWIAESRAEIDASRLLVLDVAHLMEREGQQAARHRVSLIKFHVAGMLQQVLDRAVQVHGALGLTDDTPLAMWYRHERAARIYDGPDEVHKDRLARAILQQYQSGEAS
jgi:alkylation response protein AidB-like acyl-CoA dehydrogenase